MEAFYQEILLYSKKYFKYSYLPFYKIIWKELKIPERISGNLCDQLCSIPGVAAEISYDD